MMETISGSLDEKVLVPRLRQRDELAFEEMVRAQMPRMLRVARRLLRSEEEARDAVQDAFVAAFRSIEAFEATSRLSTWLHRILVNACLMKLRAQRRRPEEDIENHLPRFLEDGHPAEPAAGWSESAQTMLERCELRGLVRRSIDELPEIYRAVLILRDLEELTTDEVAAILGTTANAVKIRLHRARQALRSILDPHLRAVLH